MKAQKHNIQAHKDKIIDRNILIHIYGTLQRAAAAHKK
jgi:hypothetical protein